MLANQMHGMENQAKRANWTSAKSAVDIISLASRGSSASSPSAELKDRKLSTLDLKEGDESGTGEEQRQEEVKSGEEDPEQKDEDEDKFYDAPEADDDMVAAVSDRTHARNQSAGSVNDIQAIADVCPGSDLRPFSAKNVMMVCEWCGVVM